MDPPSPVSCPFLHPNMPKLLPGVFQNPHPPLCPPTRLPAVATHSLGAGLTHPARSTVAAPPCRPRLPAPAASGTLPLRPVDIHPSLLHRSRPWSRVPTVKALRPPGKVPGVTLGAVPVITLVFFHTPMSRSWPGDSTTEALDTPRKVPRRALVAVPVATRGRLSYPRRDWRWYRDRLDPPPRATAVRCSPRVIPRRPRP